MARLKEMMPTAYFFDTYIPQGRRRRPLRYRRLFTKSVHKLLPLRDVSSSPRSVKMLRGGPIVPESDGVGESVIKYEKGNATSKNYLQFVKEYLALDAAN